MQKSFFTRLFSRQPKQAILPITFGKVDLPLALPAESPIKAKESTEKRKPSHYIPTNETPWVVVAYREGRWRFAAFADTREQARKLASHQHGVGYPARVVRPLIPTR